LGRVLKNHNAIQNALTKGSERINFKVDSSKMEQPKIKTKKTISHTTMQIEK